MHYLFVIKCADLQNTPVGLFLTVSDSGIVSEDFQEPSLTESF